MEVEEYLDISSDIDFKLAYLANSAEELAERTGVTTRSILKRAISLGAEQDPVKIASLMGVRISNDRFPGIVFLAVPSLDSSWDVYTQEEDGSFAYSSNAPNEWPMQEVERGGVVSRFNEQVTSTTDSTPKQHTIEAASVCTGVNKVSTRTDCEKASSAKAFSNCSPAIPPSLTPKNKKSSDEEVSRRGWPGWEEEQLRAEKAKGFSQDEMVAAHRGRNKESIKQKLKVMGLSDPVGKKNQLASIYESIDKDFVICKEKIDAVDILAFIKETIYRIKYILDGLWSKVLTEEISYMVYIKQSDKVLSNLTKGHFLKIIIADSKKIAMNDITQKISSVMSEVMMNMPEEVKARFKEAIEIGIAKLKLSATDAEVRRAPNNKDDNEQE